MQSHSRYPKRSKTHLLVQTLIRLCPVMVKESFGITITQRRTVGKASYSDRESLPRKYNKT